MPEPVVKRARRVVDQEGWRAAALRIAERAALERQRWRYRVNLRRLRMRPDQVAIDRPVFLLGVQGGGVTVLARALYRHSRTFYALGNSDFWARNEEMHNASHLSDLPEAFKHRSFHFHNTGGMVPDHPLFGLQRSWLYACDELLADTQGDVRDVTPELRTRFRRVIQRLALAYAHEPTDCRFVDMSQTYTVKVPMLAQALEPSEPRFILVTRDPYATVARAVSKEYRPHWGSHIRSDAERRRLAVEHWTNSFRLALEAADDHPMLVIRYEDYVSDPEAEIRKVCRFVELDFTTDLVPSPGQLRPLGSPRDGKWFPLDPSVNERYLTDLPAPLVEQLNSRGAAIIEKLGYDLRG